ncbi:MAG: hypothetical protein BYD32DRAFT_465061 [Podila humilis]|nr:MAG: hypothetical protein BYD32DRAFT_465061 [Podila humilis]
MSVTPYFGRFTLHTAHLTPHTSYIHLYILSIPSTTIFDILYLGMVCSQLDQHSSGQCAQVNKKWNSVLSRYIWHMIPRTLSLDRLDLFCQLALKDYLHEQHQQKQQLFQKQQICLTTQDPKSVQRPLEPHKNDGPLGRNGAYVRRLESLKELGSQLRTAVLRPAGDPVRLSTNISQHWTLTDNFCDVAPALLYISIHEYFELGSDYDEWFRITFEVPPRANSLVSHVDIIARPKRLTLIDFDQREDFSWM